MRLATHSLTKKLYLDLGRRTESRTQLHSRRDLENLIPMPTTTGQRLEGADSVGPDAIDAQDLEPKVLIRLIDVCAFEYEVVSRWDFLVNPEVKCARKQLLAGSSFERGGVGLDSRAEVANAIHNFTK